MEQSSIPSAQLLLQLCKAHGINNIVISPGSRNAPLTLSFTEDSFFTCYSVVDERSAAFFAMGIAQQLRKPVAAICTSGSALLNYYPAVAEAFYSDIPLVLISADRPFYKIDIGDGQTIRQDNVFNRHIGYSANLKLDVSHATDRIQKYAPQLIHNKNVDVSQSEVDKYNSAEIQNALLMSMQNNTPVHINIPFEEPLYDMVLKKDQIIETVVVENNLIDDFDVSEFSSIWNNAERKMVLVGTNIPNDIEQEYLDILAEDASVVFLTETTSNLHHDNFFTSIDSLIAPIEKSENKDVLFERLKPEVLLTFGGLIVSKKIKAFLRTYKPEHHWHINSKKAFDTFFCLSHHFKMHPNDFFSQFCLNLEHKISDHFNFWKDKKDNYESKRQAYLKTISFSDMLAFEKIIATIPENYQLQLSNSSTVRYAQLFDLDTSLQVFCNRGTSGIDGSVSTAVGAAIYNKAPTLLISGDLSFLYDSNGLWNNYIRADFRIIVVNNEGGGIFRILPGHRESDNFKTFFETPQNLQISHICDMYGFDFISANDSSELENALKEFYLSSEKPKLLEIKTPSIINNQILLEYFDFIS
ncbi:2-succinyl-5-enolpyruvyl-6-hydroxy-3-cyclohexene-1-carboxylic-acid synthase [Aurantibacter crassamenti]|uniref:2-succinyl-5-enolpyruvyl-6-hydroxy-3- cyclohexene-1-carboxylic-acid synthase n=1 Tax=Aurantibacter crassamenti TaxID=1837375 RepID=UPI00193A8697|nr:2-succinyl-5-enolpyruvyl-6-hydroxy-3-cyclohexene-1-carboxylic-acid synthase [Aurantibacter crassamenti]MBM1107423.1 2-succinyl-5-enolpyruvyl-6-hydroxy-3-cyclohexene-1-carboxylic-acid synthase [Aurantibacter crassamenti]